MPTQIKLKVRDGMAPTKEYVFHQRTVCTVGRAEDCDVQLPGDLLHRTVSRHHCLLDIDPPTVRVRDLGSRNGTFVNGCKIGQRDRTVVPERAANPHQPDFYLHAGGEIQVGGITFLEITLNTPDDHLENPRGLDKNQQSGHLGTPDWDLCDPCI
jgi:pSer/pThr/pTyr-binding forkhead associated (FHA) protein